MVLWSMMHPLMLSKISLRTNIRIKLNKHAVFVVTFEPIIDWSHCFKWWARIWLQVIFCQLLFLICLDWFLALVLYNAIIISIKYLQNTSLTLCTFTLPEIFSKLNIFHIISVRGALNILQATNNALCEWVWVWSFFWNEEEWSLFFFLIVELRWWICSAVAGPNPRGHTDSQPGWKGGSRMYVLVKPD